MRGNIDEFKMKEMGVGRMFLSIDKWKVDTFDFMEIDSENVRGKWKECLYLFEWDIAAFQNIVYVRLQTIWRPEWESDPTERPCSLARARHRDTREEKDQLQGCIDTLLSLAKLILVTLWQRQPGANRSHTLTL